MNALELITSLINLGVQLNVVENKLKVHAPPGIITPELQDLIKENKEALIAFLPGMEATFEIDVAPLKEYYAPSSAQKRLYFLHQFDPESTAYNMPQFVKFQGEMDREKLEGVFKKLIARHESFRTSFKIVDQELVQVILEEVDFTIDYFEVEPTEVQPIINDFIKPFDLTNPPMLRVGLIKTGVNDNILMVDMHHIISDGVSQEVLIKDFTALYANLELPKKRLQYKDFSEWQQGEVYQASLANQRQFWLDQFSEEINLLELPSDYTRPKVKSSEGGRIRFTIEEEDTARLKNITKQSGGTMFVTLLAIFNILLSKLSNQEDIIVGTPVVGRDNADLHDIIGMFTNTLALRNYPKGALSFTEFLEEVKTNTFGCLKNQSYQHEDLVESLQLHRDTSRNPLFDVLFSFQNFEEMDLEIPGFKLEPLYEEQIISKFDLTLTASELQDQIAFYFSFSARIFKETSIHRFISYFKSVVSQICNDPTRKISRINMLPEAEKNELLYGFNETVVAYPTEKSIIDLFKEQVSKNPQHIALVHNQKQITYEELDQKSNQLAHSLVEMGVEQGAVVGLMLDRSMNMVVGFLGILKASAIYLPLDKDQPESRISYILSDSKAAWLLTEEECSFDGVKNYAMSELLDNDQITCTARKATSESPAYIIYTSGSTGRPKGVLIKHQSVVNLICSQQRLFDIDATDRILQFSTLVFDASIEQMGLALLSGAALVVVDKAIASNSIKLERYIVNQRITHFHATPSYLEGIELEKENSLRRIVSGGEECKTPLVRKFIDRYDFYNKYGPTETTVTSLVKYFPKGSTIEEGLVSIGGPINNTFVYILGKHGELLPTGSIGELCVGGDSLAMGYMHDEGLTREKFINNPFIEGQRIYKTGDLARWRTDGEIEYMGRIDNQVKIRGFRIELGEIENRLASFEQINEAAVTLLEKDNDKFLVAYYVADSEIPVGELRTYLLTSLTDYMVPTYFVHLSSLPLTINGKLNRKALPNPEFTIGSDHIDPSNPTEVKLVQIWSDLLKLDKDLISTNKSFFELGGHSLKAVLLVNKIFQELDIELTLFDVFSKQEIKSLSDYIITVKNMTTGIAESENTIKITI